MPSQWICIETSVVFFKNIFCVY